MGTIFWRFLIFYLPVKFQRISRPAENFTKGSWNSRVISQLTVNKLTLVFHVSVPLLLTMNFVKTSCRTLKMLWQQFIVNTRTWRQFVFYSNKLSLKISQWACENFCNYRKTKVWLIRSSEIIKLYPDLKMISDDASCKTRPITSAFIPDAYQSCPKLPSQ